MSDNINQTYNNERLPTIKNVAFSNTNPQTLVFKIYTINYPLWRNAETMFI